MRIKNIIITALVILELSTTVFGQQHTENKADQTLRGSGRVNPSTLGMEFEVPLSNYSGRGASRYVLKSSNGGTLTYTWGLSTDTEVPNDYDGDGKADIAIWRNSTGVWYILNSSGNPATRTVGWGMAGDIPVPAFYRR